jgi:hypothetical protein
VTNETGRGFRSVVRQFRHLVEATREGRAEDVQEIIGNLARRHRLLAPLAFAVDAFAMLFEGLKLLATNWRLTLIQLLPAMWIWAAMLDLKVHALHGRSFHILRGPILLLVAAAVIAVTAAGYFLNAVFAFAISAGGPPNISAAMVQTRSHLRSVAGFGAAIGATLAFATLVTPRWGPPWFAVTLSIVIGLMMVTYVAVPARFIGVQTSAPKGAHDTRRNQLTAAAVGGALGAVVCSPPYVLARIGLLMLGSSRLFILGIALLTIGFILYAGATSAVKTIKISAKIVASQSSEPEPSAVESQSGS